MSGTKTNRANEIRKKSDHHQGGNQRITNGNYDKALAVKCINGIFVGRDTDGIVSYKGIPFVGKQPVGELRWKAPADVIPNDGVYEAYHYGKAPVQAPGDPAAEYGTRGLPVSEHLEDSRDGGREKAGHGVDLRRRFRCRRND